jgi:tetratricopeptide (TPR) repeat protein
MVVDALDQSSVTQKVHLKLPGARIVSEVQAWAYLQDFAEGIRCFERLQSPSAADERWVGVCYFQLIDDSQALRHFENAIARGEQAARINLAHLLRFLERSDETGSVLRSIDLQSLSEYDRVFYFRIVSVDEENNGNLREALRAAEEAWRQVQRIPEYGILAPAILAQLGLLHSRIGRAQRSLWFLDRALQITEGTEHLKTRLRRALVLQMLGRNNESLTELQALSRSGIPAAFVPELQFYRGELLWAAKHIDDAESAFQTATTIAREHQLVYEEFIASLSLVGISLLKNGLAAAQAYLSRAQGLVSDKTDRLNFRFREIQYLHASGGYAAAHAEHELQALDEEFMKMGLLQEQAYVKLHRAGILQRMSDLRYQRLLDDLISLSVTLQSRAFLAREWMVFPDLQRVARRSHPELVGISDTILELHTLASEQILLAGEPVRIPLKKAPEVLAYFLEHKAVSLDRLLRDVFPDEKPRSAKSYFHQVRHQLKEHVEGLEIEFDRETRLYRLKSEVDILWDVAELRAGRQVAETGPFLPGSGNDWALMLDHSLERFRDAPV